MSNSAVKQTTEPVKLANPFCRTFVPIPPLDYSSQVYVYRVSDVIVDKETLLAKPQFEKVDLVAEVQACKNLCGLEYMKALLQRGLAKPEDFAAKPSDFHDVTQVPSDVHTAARLADLRSDQLAKLAQAIGISPDEELTPELFEKRFAAYIAENWKPTEQSAEVK